MPKPRADGEPPFEVADPYKLAHRLLAQPSGLDLRILVDLVGRPKRYSELRHLVAGKRDHNLTVALGRLRLDGLIDQRADVTQAPVIHSYELTVLGIHVLFASRELQFGEHVQRYLQSVEA